MSTNTHNIPVPKRIHLPKRHRVFIKEYLVDLNGTRAAIAAGFSECSAGTIAGRLLQKVGVALTIQKEMDERAERTRLKAADILQEIRNMAFANIMDYVTINEDGQAYVDLTGLQRDKASAIQEVQVEERWEGPANGEKTRVVRTKFKLSDKLRGLELLGKHMKLFNETVEMHVTHTLQESDKIQASRSIEKIQALESDAEKPLLAEYVDEA